MEAATELGRGLPGEGDGRHVLYLVGAQSDAGGHAFGQHLGLARSGAGLDEDVRPEGFANEAAGLAIDRAGLSHGR
jgi:hypothetical protein